MPSNASTAFEFGPFRLDLAAATLSGHGLLLPLRPKAFALLVLLVRRQGQLVSKDEVLDLVWGRRFVSEGVIKTAIGELRSVLGDDPKHPRWISTVARRGYRFAGLEQQPPASAAQGLAPAGSSRQATPARTGLADNLDAEPLPLVGRENELSTLYELLRRHRLVTLAGPPGVGKTRLAAAAAHQLSHGDLGPAQFAQSGAAALALRDGVWWLELAALSPAQPDPASATGQLVQQLAARLQLGGQADHDAAALGRALQPLQLLLVLDNAAHMRAALGPLLTQVLAGAPGVRVLVTSQQPLHLADEQVLRLAPLPLPPIEDTPSGHDSRWQDCAAVRLLLNRITDRLPAFTPQSGDGAALTQICRQLDGLPLALELAAARVPLLGVQGLAAALRGAEGPGRLALLGGLARDTAARQGTLQQALHWSHALLGTAQQRVFRRLSVFSGGFTLAAAQAVCSDEGIDAWQVLDALEALVDKSLLVLCAVHPGGEGSPTLAPRLALLASVRDFARQRLDEAGEWQQLQHRHLRFSVEQWRRADARALSTPALAWLALHGPETDNLRAALRWALAQAGVGAAAATKGSALVGAEMAGSAAADTAAVSLVVHAVQLWLRAGLAAEGRLACEAVRPLAVGNSDPALRHGFDLAVATLAMSAHAYPASQGHAAALRAAAGFESLGDDVRATYAWYVAFQMQLRLQAPANEIAASVQRMTAHESPLWGELLTRYRRQAVGYQLRLAGDTSAYLESCRSELARCQRLGAVAEAWHCAQGLMLAEHDSGHFEAALRVGAQALAEIKTAGRLRLYPALLALWVTMLAQHGQTTDARRALVEALPVTHSTGTPWMLQAALAWLALQEGRAPVAAQLLGWQQHTQASGRATAAGGTVAQVLRELRQQLARQLDGTALTRWLERGAELSDAEAEVLAMAGQV